LKYHIHENGWTVILDDFDFAQSTQADINQIACFLATNTLVVARNQQHLTVADEVRVGEMFGGMESIASLSHLPTYSGLALEGSNGQVVRVTGELDEHGQPGLFGHVDDLDWHCNQPAMETRRPLVWLLGVRGTAGSRTSWTNNILAYEDLSAEVKEQIQDLKMVCGWRKGSYSDFDFAKETGATENFNEYYTPRMVHTNEGGQTGLFFPFLQFKNFVGMTEDQSREFIKPLRDHVLQDKYIYHHDWQDGDVVIAEQWLGIHKRWRFEGMDQRVLHRTTFNYDNVDLSGISSVVERNVANV